MPLPVAQVICTNTSPSDPYNHTNYTWYFGSNDTIASTQASSTYTYYYNGTYTISLSANNSVDGCSTTSATQTVTISNATTPPACNANFTYTVGSAGQVSFTSLYAGIAPDTTHQWDFGDGSRYDAPTITHTYYPNGTYTVTLYVSDAANACYASSSQTVSISNAVTPCAPTVNFIVHKDSLNPQPGVWEISSYYSSQVTSAVWNWGDGTSTIGFAPTHTYAIVGQYNICVMVFSSCGDSSYVCQNDSLYRTNSGMIAVTVLNVNATGISKNLNLNNQITVYPNPSTGLFTLNLSNTAATKAQISISNILGEVVFNSQEQINNNAFTKEMDMQHLANGAYFMKVSVGNKTFSSKLIISK
jgi:PKD repeat protein